MGKPATASAQPTDPFAVDEDRALSELELAWSDGGYHGFTVEGGTWGVSSPAVIVSSARWALAAGPGSADRNGAKYWPGCRRRSSASAVTASCRAAGSRIPIPPGRS